MFLTQSGEWTTDKNRACDSYREKRICSEILQGKRLENVEWYYWFPGEEKYDFKAPFVLEAITNK